MTTSGINAINPVLYTKMPFDPMKDLEPVARWCRCRTCWCCTRR
jgi:hypothetical protein